LNSSFSGWKEREEERKEYFEIKEKGVYNLPITHVHARARSHKERERERKREIHN
jgi:hypothetical protein